MNRPKLPRAHPYGPSSMKDTEAWMASLYETAQRKRTKAPRRPRGYDKKSWFAMPREYRRRHYWCCIASASYCPFCGKWDPDQNDGHTEPVK